MSKATGTEIAEEMATNLQREVGGIINRYQKLIKESPDIDNDVLPWCIENLVCCLMSVLGNRLKDNEGMDKFELLVKRLSSATRESMEKERAG